MQPKISVIIPAYNCGKTVRQSVESAMLQTERDLQILLLDDCSTDETANILNALAKEDSRILTYISPQNRGVAETRNHGMALALGTYIAFLDGDDIWLPDKLERQLADMERRGLDLSYTAYYLMDEAGRPAGKDYSVPESLDYDRLLRENVIGCSAALFRRETAAGIYMRGEYAHEDYVFWLELLQKGCKAGGVDLPLMGYRVLAGSRSADKKKAAAGRWSIYRKFLKLPAWKAAVLLAEYGIRGIRKHFIRG